MYQMHLPCTNQSSVDGYHRNSGGHEYHRNNGDHEYHRNSGYPNEQRLPSFKHIHADEDFRAQFSGMSMGISQLNHGSTDSLHSNSNQERGDIVSPKYEKRSVYESSRASFDPVRCDQDVPVNKIMQLEDGFRRHSIANMNNTPFDPKSFPYAIYSAPSSPRHPPYDSTDHFVPYQCLPSPIKRQNQHTPYIKDRSRRESYGSRRSSRVYFDESDMKDLFVSRSDHEGVYRRPSEVQSDSQFSRSPELKIMHKLAERKRRKEMRDLFDELKDTLPVDKYSKTSKWEILTKAVEYINALKKNDYAMEQELLSLRYELSNVKNN